jgi:hypothetical protein
MPQAAPWVRYLQWGHSGRFSPAIWPVLYMTQLLVALWLAMAFTHFLMGAPKDFALLRLITVVVLTGGVVYGLGAQFLHLPTAVEPWLLCPLASISGFMTLEWLLSARHGVPFAITPTGLLVVLSIGITLGFVIWLSRRLPVTPNNRWRGP